MRPLSATHWVDENPLGGRGFAVDRLNFRQVMLLLPVGAVAEKTRGWHSFGVFDKAVSSWCDNLPEEHGLTEDGKTVPPFFLPFVFVP